MEFCKGQMSVQGHSSTAPLFFGVHYGCHSHCETRQSVGHGRGYGRLQGSRYANVTVSQSNSVLFLLLLILMNVRKKMMAQLYSFFSLPQQKGFRVCLAALFGTLHSVGPLACRRNCHYHTLPLESTRNCRRRRKARKEAKYLQSPQ